MSKQDKTILIIAVALILFGFIFLLVKNRQSPSISGVDKTGVLKPISAADHVKGEASAPLQMIVYSDFECQFCADYAKTMKQVESEFAGKVLIAFRHYPLAGHPQARKAAEASECAGAQGKFWEMHDKLFVDNIAGNMSEEQFKKDAADLGLDQAKFNQCLDSAQYQSVVTGDLESGKTAGVTGTPTSFINGKIYPGAYPFEDFMSSTGQPEKGLKSIISELLK